MRKITLLPTLHARLSRNTLATEAIGNLDMIASSTGEISLYRRHAGLLRGFEAMLAYMRQPDGRIIRCRSDVCRALVELADHLGTELLPERHMERFIITYIGQQNPVPRAGRWSQPWSVEEIKAFVKPWADGMPQLDRLGARQRSWCFPRQGGKDGRANFLTGAVRARLRCN